MSDLFSSLAGSAGAAAAALHIGLQQGSCSSNWCNNIFTMAATAAAASTLLQAAVSILPPLLPPSSAQAVEAAAGACRIGLQWGSGSSRSAGGQGAEALGREGTGTASRSWLSRLWVPTHVTSSQVKDSG